MGKWKFVDLMIVLLVMSKLSAIGQQSDISVSKIRVHDPVMIKDKDLYHLFCTGQGISHFISPDMKSWEKVRNIFSEKPSWTNKVVSDFKNHIWAPDVIFRNGQYYLYYSVSAFGKNTSAIGVTTNVTLDTSDINYKWIDHGIVIQSHANRDLWNAIDPNIALDNSGEAWMSFGSFWEGLKMVKLDSNMTTIAEPQEWVTIARRDRADSLADNNPGNAAIEAPFIFKKNDYYYLFASWDYCCRGKESTYKVVVGRSRNIKGPYLDKDGLSMYQGGGSLILQGDTNWYGAGHCSVYTLDNKDIMVFHAYDGKDEGRPKLRISELQWDDNLWPKEIKDF